MLSIGPSLTVEMSEVAMGPGRRLDRIPTQLCSEAGIGSFFLSEPPHRLDCDLGRRASAHALMRLAYTSNPSTGTQTGSSAQSSTVF